MSIKMIGIDSSGLVASVAILEDEQLIAEYTLNYKKTHSQTLLPMLDEITRMTELKLETIDAIAIAAGPGSFTGLRIGSATAKGLGFALDKPLVAVSTLDAMAYNLCGTDKVVCPIMDARRNQVYTGIYDFTPQKVSDNSKRVEYNLNVIREECAVMMEEILEQLNGIGRETVFVGDGIPVFNEMIVSKMKIPFSYAPIASARQRAASVAALGCIYFKKGKIQKAEEHSPNYLRLSQAERERKEAGLL